MSKMVTLPRRGEMPVWKGKGEKEAIIQLDKEPGGQAKPDLGNDRSASLMPAINRQIHPWTRPGPMDIQFPDLKNQHIQATLMHPSIHLSTLKP